MSKVTQLLRSLALNPVVWLLRSLSALLHFKRDLGAALKSGETW